MVGRPKIPADLEAEVLSDNDHTCCVCHTSGKDVQIHHIDGNRNNNVLGNLTVLCLDCHSKVTGTRGLGKRYTPVEVQLYKEDWEENVRRKRKMNYVKPPTVSVIRNESLEAMIRDIVYSLAATKDLAFSRRKNRNALHV